MKLDLNYKFKSRLHRSRICTWGLDRGRVDKNKELMSGPWVMNLWSGSGTCGLCILRTSNCREYKPLPKWLMIKMERLDFFMKNYIITLCNQWLDFYYADRLSLNYNKNDPVGHSLSFLFLWLCHKCTFASWFTVRNFLYSSGLSVKGLGFGIWCPNKTFAASYSTLKLI